uniref:Uncharacterized protein n=1 Tax=Oryzias latipes TaxID=8090 RepID=A0A3B3IDF1_ORYLA
AALGQTDRGVAAILYLPCIYKDTHRTFLEEREDSFFTECNGNNKIFHGRKEQNISWEKLKTLPDLTQIISFINKLNTSLSCCVCQSEIKKECVCLWRGI